MNCGCEFLAKTARKSIYCEDCRAIKRKESRDKWHREYKKMKPAKKEIKQAKPSLSIYEVANLAKKANMTYGQYVAEMGI